MPDVTINYIAVVVAALLGGMALGFIWYGPLFGKQWMKVVEIDQKKIDAAKKKGMGKTYALSTLGALIMAYVLAHFVNYAQATTVVAGLQVGFWAWLGFVATTMLNNVLFGNKSWKAYQIEAGYQLVALLIMGAVLSVWG